MMKILIHTQYHENYGAHEWDGKGECPQYWKSKGGSEIELDRELTWNEASDTALVNSLVEKARALINKKNNYFEEYVVDWELITPDYLTWFEKSQLEFDGKIMYPRKKLAVA